MNKLGKVYALVIVGIFLAVILSQPVTASDITMNDDEWIGLGVAKGRIVFDDQSTDQIEIMTANVGIGTTSPGHKLDVVGLVEINKDGYQIELNTAVGDARAQIKADEATGNTDAYLSIDVLDDSGSGWTEVMRMDGGGSVGIGTTSLTSGRTLTVVDGIYINGKGLTLKSGTSENERYGLKYGEDNSIDDSDDLMLTNREANGDLRFATSGSTGGGAGETTRMIITYDGKVGIGDTTPDAKLDVEVSSGGLAIIGTSTSSATGHFAIALGANADATAENSIAIGVNTNAQGIASIAIGCGATTGVSASASIAIGTSTATGVSSTAIGSGTTASGMKSTAMGSQITAQGDYSFGIGIDNTGRTITQTNTMAIMGGKVGIGTVSPSTTLEVDGDVAFGKGSDLQITSGAVTVTHSYHLIDTESAGATDDLDTINGGDVAGQILIIRAKDSTHTVVAKDGTGNLILDTDFSLNHVDDTLTLLYDGTNWIELSNSDNGT